MLLSFGGNWPYVSDLFFKYFPLYNKFREVESILAVASLCFPILAILAIKEAVDAHDKRIDILKKLKLALYITGGLLLLLIKGSTRPILRFRSARPGKQWRSRAYTGASK